MDYAGDNNADEKVSGARGAGRLFSEEILNSLVQAVLLFDADNRVSECYGNAESLFYRSHDSLTGCHASDLPVIGQAVNDLVNRCRAENIPLNSYDTPVIPALGDVGLADLHAQPWYPSSGYLPSGGQTAAEQLVKQAQNLPVKAAQVGGMTLVSIQPRRIAAFLEQRDDMEAAAQAVSGLASMLAHEIKNPLSGIRGAAQLLGRSGGPAQVRMTELICKEVDRIKNLVDELETFSQTERHDLGPVNIHEVLDHVVEISVAGFARNCHVRPVFDPSLPPVFGHFDRLVQVFLNLIKNAVEAAGSDAALTITTAYRQGIWLMDQDGKRRRLPVEVTIKDNGPGVAEAIKPHLFDPFISGRGGGTGLGLALVARFVSEMGGAVSCENPPDGGAVFKVQLALSEDSENDT